MKAYIKNNTRKLKTGQEVEIVSYVLSQSSGRVHAVVLTEFGEFDTAEISHLTTKKPSNA